jgi:hypothetical protein
VPSLLFCYNLFPLFRLRPFLWPYTHSTSLEQFAAGLIHNSCPDGFSGLPLPVVSVNFPVGRPVGSKNRIQSTVKQKIVDFVTSDFNNLIKDIKKLDAKDSVLIYKKITNKFKRLYIRYIYRLPAVGRGFESRPMA